MEPRAIVSVKVADTELVDETATESVSAGTRVYNLSTWVWLVGVLQAMVLR